MSAPDSRFWTFSLAVYADPAVQAECLDLQDRHGIDVNLLLFCAYIGAACGAIVPEAALREAAGSVGAWHTHIVRNLRAARRALKPLAADPSAIGMSAAALHGTVKAAELEAERIEHLMLEQWSAPRLEAWPRAAPATAVVANIGTVLAISAATGPTRPGLPAHLVAAALAHASSG